ncbi:bacterial cell division membrane protein [Aequorivita sublithincola DSM 14238]|uniref:Cell wall polymerase n=1 Tax=Aequorivita sublithincola (strain DSM 14238 / LMG 21431 / ACAM 643 / 9-3) TaxID=746697 RepID=I3YSV6_AEQSU|nr:rod shape-determining protein RodA [Aequorivita sublithincola]AFL80074.1 bacterial cell division membrane protein [Aequorivita sublithincola DSM 14238]
MAATRSYVRFDWLIICIYIALVSMGWINIYSASLSDAAQGFFDFDQIYGKQMIWIGLSIILIIFVLAIESKFYENYASVIYIASLLSLLGLFVFGTTIAGTTAWYDFGGTRLQPSEFAKIATALALSKYVSDIQTNMQKLKHQIAAFVILALPVILIIMQPDPGSVLVYAAFVFPLYREGLHGVYLLLALFAIVLFVSTLAFGTIWVALAILLIAGAIFYKNRKRRPNIIKYILIAVSCIVFAFSVSYIFNNVFKQHHRDRFNIVLGKEVDARGIGYNTNQSEIAISNGGWLGKGWTQGTQTKGNFVPEQHTDYIFSTVGEEWGFLGSMVVVLLFIALITRIIFRAEKQKNQFGRVYGYSVAAILFLHFFVNIGMVLGIFPTVGIPLPFFSYGGSALWGFTIMLFIFVKLDGANSHYA